MFPSRFLPIPNPMKITRASGAAVALCLVSVLATGDLHAQLVRTPAGKTIQETADRRSRRGIDARDSATANRIRHPGFTSTHDIAQSTLERTDQLRFFIDRHRALALRAPQLDSMRALRDAMRAEQKPLFRLLSKVDDGENKGPKLGEMPPGSGGGRGGGSRGLPPQQVDSVLFPDKPRVARGPSDSARALVSTLSDVQERYTDHGRALLSADQLRRADSLWGVKLVKDRDRR